MSKPALVVSSALSSYGADQMSDEDILIPSDPVLAPSLPQSPSHSRAKRPIRTLQPNDIASPAEATEIDPLLGGERQNASRKKKPFYRPRPMWIVPYAIMVALARGMTLAPRVEVFTQLACQSVLGHNTNYNHTHTHQLSSNTQRTEVAENLSFFNQSTILPIIGLHADESDKSEDVSVGLPAERCLKDSQVQAVAARLQTALVIVMGIVSTLTTGWWGHFGERHGRTKVMAVGAVGMLITDLTFAAITLPNSSFAAHGHVLLVVAPFFEGLLGGWSSLQGATSAYISDCTSDGSRSHIFSRFMGVFFLGFALGPVLGAWVIRHSASFLSRVLQVDPVKTGRSVLPVFWIAVILWTISIVLSLFIVPESLEKNKEKKVEPTIANHPENGALESQQIPKVMTCDEPSLVSSFVRIFVPLLVFAPKKRLNGKDWSMTLLALALFGYLLSSGIFQLKYLYAEHVFGWEAEQLSYYITFVGGARAVNLLFVMPAVINTFKPKFTPTTKQLNDTPVGKKPKPTRSQLIAEMKFDLLVTRVSLVLDILSHTLVSLSSTASTTAAQISFAGFTVLSSFGSGAYPSIQSLALCLQKAHEDELAKEANSEATSLGTGSLFGALAVIQAAGQMILGPMLFGLVYSMTVATFPKGIFVLAGSILLVSILILAGVSPQRALGNAKRKNVAVSHSWQGSDAERGRSRVSKDLSGNFRGQHAGGNSNTILGDSNSSHIYEHSTKSVAADAPNSL